MFFIGLAVAFSKYYTGQQKTTYLATLSFMTSNDKGGGMSSVLQLAGQFGLGGGGGGGVASEKLMALLQSKRMIYKALMNNASIEGKKQGNPNDLLFNHFIDMFDMAEKWATDPMLKGFRFSQKDPKNFTLAEHKAAKNIYGMIVRQFLQQSATKAGVINVNFESEVDVFPKDFLTILVDELSNYYISKTIEKQKETFEIIKNRSDSLETALYNAEYELATWADKHRNALRAGTLTAEKLMERERVKRTAELLNILHSEATANLEIAGMNLLNSTPALQVIDYPTLPLGRNEPQAQFILMIAMAMAVIVATMLIAFNKLIQDALKS